MINLSKWNVSIECGPTVDDVHDIVVDASSTEDAKKKATKWAADNNVTNPVFSEPYRDNYDDFLDWSDVEEQEFLYILDNHKPIKDD